MSAQRLASPTYTRLSLAVVASEGSVVSGSVAPVIVIEPFSTIGVRYVSPSPPPVTSTTGFGAPFEP